MKKLARRSSLYARVAFVRSGMLTANSRKERSKNKRTYDDLMAASDDEIVNMFLEDKILERLEGRCVSALLEGQGRQASRCPWARSSLSMHA